MGAITELYWNDLLNTPATPLTGLGGNRFFSPPAKWAFAGARFKRFLANIEPTEAQQEDVFNKAAGILTRLDQHYYGGALPSGWTSLVLAGSWAKGTRARQTSDLDMIYLLPWALANRFQYQENAQSRILQDVRSVLMSEPLYRRTEIRSDGPTVIVNFDSYKIEIAPGFRDAATTFIYDPIFKVWLCHTKNGGCYKATAPAAEHAMVHQANAVSNGNLVAVIRMAKIWKRYCNVPIKSIAIQQLAVDFLNQWPHAKEGYCWYDWMMRDFFAYILSHKDQMAFLPVTFEPIQYGSDWVSRAETAFKNATRACTWEEISQNAWAGEEWQKIFGYDIPKEG